MKYFVLLIFFYSGSCASQPMLADSVIIESSLRETLLFLSQDSLKGRLTGAKGTNIAATFIAAKFHSIGLMPLGGTDGYYDNFVTRYEGKKIRGKNVIAVIQGKVAKDTMIIFSAHYDHIGQRDDLPFNKEYNSKDEIFNGANDNATGVAALLELAKYYKAQNNNHYQLAFVAFAGEEMGMLGSAHLNKKINPAIVKAVINLEMLGRPEKQSCFIVSFRNKAIRNLLNSYHKQYLAMGENFFFETDPYSDENLAYRSDHYPFSNKIKNAFTIMGTSPQDIYYHSVDDEYETINFDFLLKATKNIALACEQFTR